MQKRQDNLFALARWKDVIYHENITVPQLQYRTQRQPGPNQRPPHLPSERLSESSVYRGSKGKREWKYKTLSVLEGKWLAKVKKKKKKTK